MRVVLATSTVPFVHGGAGLIVDWLEEELRLRGHEVDTFRLPVEASPRRLPVESVGMRLHDLTGHGDRLIALRTPSYLVRHHSKVAWFIHHHRPAYDLWDTHPDVPHDADGWEFRRMLHAADELGLGECRHVFSNSRRMADRLQTYNGLDSEVLYPPMGTGAAARLRPGPLGDAVVCVARVVPHKRQLLLVEAMARTTTAVRLVLAGTGEATYREEIFAAVDRLGLAHRVSFLDTLVSERTKGDLLANALAVAFVPEDEDSYGFSGLEAATAGKALVTVTDSGGVLELVEHDRNGLVAEPDPASLAACFDRLHADRALAARLGEAQADKLRSLHIDWDHVIARLLA